MYTSLPHTIHRSLALAPCQHCTHHPTPTTPTHHPTHTTLHTPPPHITLHTPPYTYHPTHTTLHTPPPHTTLHTPPHTSPYTHHPTHTTPTPTSLSQCYGCQRCVILSASCTAGKEASSTACPQSHDLPIGCTY